MEILKDCFGQCQTNCYILKDVDLQVVIDPGDGAFDWIVQNCNNIGAVLCTHGHFDHVFDCKKLQDIGAKIYIHKSDELFLKNDPFGLLHYNLIPDFYFNSCEILKIGSFEFKFHHFPGHTPGCGMIECKDYIFSGDFLFKGSFGRCDFPFSNRDDMVNSLCLVQKYFNKNYHLYPGHGDNTTLEKELGNIPNYINYVKFYG